MRMSSLFGKTLRQAEARGSTGTLLLIRAGYLRWEPRAWLPLGTLLLRKGAALWRDEVSPEAQELSLQRWQNACVEEAVLAVASREIASYRDLPAWLWVETPAEASSCTHLESGTAASITLGFYPDAEAIEEDLARRVQRVEAFLSRCGLKSAGPAHPGGWDWLVPVEDGDAVGLRCSGCGYRAPVRWATPNKPPLPPEEPLPVEEVATPDCTTIEAVANFVGVPKSKTLKAVFYSHRDGRIVFAVIRGDLDVNETKLAWALDWAPLKVATEAELFMAGVVAGYASPVGIRKGSVTVIADDSLRTASNLVAGANKEGYHFVNVNYPRDFQADVETDIALAHPGDPCPRCGLPLEEERGVVVASLRRMKANFTYNTSTGGRAQAWVGLLALYPERLAEAMASVHRDERGLVWPEDVAPFRIHLIGLGEEGLKVAEELYRELTGRGYEVLFDDRDESPGVKFNDADLMGMPVRIVVGRRSLAQGGVELKRRGEERGTIVPKEELFARL